MPDWSCQGIQRFARSRADRARSAHAVLTPLEVKGAGGRAPRLSLDHDEFRLWSSVDLGDREKLPFAVVREILLKVGFPPDLISHVY
jgi:hypothetical protein